MAVPLLALAGLAVEAVPAIARWLGGDTAGDTADAVASVARRLTGHDDQDAAAAAIRADPKLALQFKIEMANLDARIEEAYLADRADARQRDVLIQQARGRNLRGDILALGATGGLVALTWALLFVNVPDGPARDVLLMLSGALIAIVKDVFAFEFGSSRGSKEKDAALAGRK